MQVKLFPEEQFKLIEVEKSNAINEEQKKHSTMLDTIRKEHTTKPDVSFYGVCGAVVGTIIAFFICLANDNNTSMGMGAWFMTWPICAVIAAIIGVFIGKGVVSSWEDGNNSIAQKEQNEINRTKRKIEEINSTYQKMYENYVKNFELTAQQESVKFAESRLAKEVIEWMTDGFSKTIDATDRRSHIERINVPFAFNVYTNKITCNLGTYDFEIKRCSNLTSPIEQTALARAIASAIQLNIVMKYPQDESGTSISINIDYNYSTECPTTTVTYVAPNGNYRAVEKW